MAQPQPSNVIPFPAPPPDPFVVELAAAVDALIVLPPADRELAMKLAGFYAYRPAR